MPLPLSYPGLKCVLENLEPVKRVHIVGRSPVLHKIDKLTPLRLKDFWIVEDEMTINNLKVRWNKFYGVEFEKNGKTVNRKRAENREDKMKKFINFFFCGRSIIHVGRLLWCYSLLPDFLPVDMKFRVNSLSAAIPFIDPRSFPLKTLFTTIAIIDDRVVKSAETLILNLIYHEKVTIEDLKKLNNKKVVFEVVYYSRIEMVSLIKYHIDTKKATGTTFVISTGFKSYINNMLREFEQAFGDFQCNLDSVNERFIPGLPKFLIPINNESRIQVFAIEGPEQHLYTIIVKPVPEISGI